MAHTDKTEPYRLNRRPATNTERLVGVGRGGTKKIKRVTAKKERRSDGPAVERLRGYRYIYGD